MKVWLVFEDHKCEGRNVLAVLAWEPTEEQAKDIAAARSSYDYGERRRLCSVCWVDYDVEP